MANFQAIILLTVALVVSHTGLVSLPVPVVGQQNSTLLHAPVVPANPQKYTQ